MSLNFVPPKPTTEIDDSTIFNAPTPPETIQDDFLDSLDPLGTPKTNSSVPWPGSSYILRSSSSGKVLTLLDGKVVLLSPGRRGNIHFACVETKGWLGFKDVASGRFLGHDKGGKIVCNAQRHQAWENFCVRMTPDGGYVLMMQHWERLWHVGVTMDQGVERVAKIGERMADGMVWEFVKV